MGKPLPSLLLISSPDDYLLELERDDVTTAWRGAHPEGETVTFDEAPLAGRLIEELAAPSLFAPERLLVVTNANPYMKAGRADDGDALGRALASLPLRDVTLLLTAVTKEAPEGAVADTVRDRGEVRFLALPEPPKPWEDVRTSKEQRSVLATLVGRVAPSLAGQREVVDALIEAYGFRPRALAQAAERLILSGEPNAATVREQAGAGECTLRDLEEALIGRTAQRFVRLASIIASGGVLTDWRGEAVSPDRAAMVLASTFGRLLRQGLAVRAHAVRAGLRSELQPERCAGGGWYTRTFKPRLYPLLSADIEATAGSPAEGRTAWQLHRAFRLAAAYPETELVEALADLAGSRAERDRGPAALAAVSALVLGFIAPRTA